MVSEKYNTTATLEGRVRDLERRIRTMETAPRLPNSSIGTGGLIVEDGGNLTVRDGGNVLIEDGGDILLNNGGQIIAVEEDGGTVRIADGTLYFKYDSSENYGSVRAGLDITETRTALWVRPPWSGASQGNNHFILEGSSADNGGNAWLDTDGELTLSSGSEMFIESGASIFMDTTSATGDIVMTSARNAFLTAANEVVIDSATNNVFITHTTTANAANGYITTTGRVLRSTSALKYKQDIEDLVVDKQAVLGLRPRTWRDKQQLIENPDSTQRYVGFIAEELQELGLETFLVYDEAGELDAIAYDRLSAALIVVIQDLHERLLTLEG